VNTVSFAPLGRRAEAKPDETLLDAARRAAVPLGNSCGGVGVCARCVVEVLRGAESLTPPTELELRRGLDGRERLACQAIARGDVEITTTYW
jgi:ferredoxin